MAAKQEANFSDLNDICDKGQNAGFLPMADRRQYVIVYDSSKKAQPSRRRGSPWYKRDPKYRAYEDLRPAGMMLDHLGEVDKGLQKRIDDTFECKTVKCRSADDFMMTHCVATPEQTSLTPASGEGHCTGACALIPTDIRPLIQRAYEDSDFDNVDTTPVILPMLGDDGIYRREYPTVSDSNQGDMGDGVINDGSAHDMKNSDDKAFNDLVSNMKIK